MLNHCQMMMPAYQMGRIDEYVVQHSTLLGLTPANTPEYGVLTPIPGNMELDSVGKVGKSGAVGRKRQPIVALHGHRPSPIHAHWHMMSTNTAQEAGHA